MVGFNALLAMIFVGTSVGVQVLEAEKAALDAVAEAATATSASGAAVAQGGSSWGPAILGAPELVEHALTICNAFAYNKPLDAVTLSKRTKLTETPMQFKECKELPLKLQEGERIEFKAGPLSVGTFHATGLPKTSTHLLLIPHRRNNHTLAVAFDSHAFSDLETTGQIAVVDTYIGEAVGSLQIMDHRDRNGKDKRKEVLKPSSVVALSNGYYEVTLEDKDGKAVVSAPLRVAGQTKCVVLRVGADGGSGQDLVVFSGNGDRKHGQATSQQSGAAHPHLTAAGALALAGLVATLA